MSLVPEPVPAIRSARWSRCQVPTDFTPCLHDSLIGHKFELPPIMKLPEDAEWTARFPADLRRIGLEVESLYRPAQQLDSLELLCIGEGGIDTLRGSFENCLLMDGFCGVREAIMGGSPDRDLTFIVTLRAAPLRLHIEWSIRRRRKQAESALGRSVRHSYRSATSGLTRDARSAGIAHAAIVTIASVATTRTNVPRSLTFTPNTRLDTASPNATAAITPQPMPMAATFIPSNSVIRSTP